MSMRINNLFEHDASMKRHVESAMEQNNSNNMSGNSAFDDIPEDEPLAQTTKNTSVSSSKPAAQRHRASIACASCRDRRIRVGCEL
jgi:hypothetical protein